MCIQDIHDYCSALAAAVALQIEAVVLLMRAHQVRPHALAAALRLVPSLVPCLVPCGRARGLRRCPLAPSSYEPRASPPVAATRPRAAACAGSHVLFTTRPLRQGLGALAAAPVALRHRLLADAQAGHALQLVPSRRRLETGGGAPPALLLRRDGWPPETGPVRTTSVVQEKNSVP